MTKLLSTYVPKGVWDETAIEYGLVTTMIGLAVMIFFLAPLP
jgi:Flp pilus assembly pilin Flp